MTEIAWSPVLKGLTDPMTTVQRSAGHSNYMYMGVKDYEGLRLVKSLLGPFKSLTCLS